MSNRVYLLVGFMPRLAVSDMLGLTVLLCREQTLVKWLLLFMMFWASMLA